MPVRTIDARIYGRTISVYWHPGGFFLTHYKPRSRSSRMYRTIGQWLLSIDGVLIGRRVYFNHRAIRQPPIRWANQVVQSYWEKQQCRKAFTNTLDVDPDTIRQNTVKAYGTERPES